MVVPLGCLVLATPVRAGIDNYGLLTAVNSSPGTVIAFSTLTNTTIGSVISVGDYPQNALFSPDGRYAYVTGTANAVTVIDVAAGAVVNTIPIGTRGSGMVMSPDGQYIYVAGPNNNSVNVIATATNQVVGSAIPVSSAFEIAISPNGSTLYVTNFYQNTVSVVDAASRTVTATIAVSSEPNAIAVSPDGSKLYVTSGTSTTTVVSVIDTATRNVLTTIPLDYYASAITVSRDGTRIYVADQGQTVYVIDAASNAVLTTLTIPINVLGVTTTPDGSRVYLSGAFNAYVLDPATNTIVGTVTTPFNDNLNIGTGWIGPNVIVATGGAVSAGSDAALTALGFDQYVIFNGGTLKLDASFSTAKTISLLALGGVVDTNGFDLTLSGTIINNGMLTKAGLGTLTLTGDNTYTGGTLVLGGLINFSAANNFGTGQIWLDGGGLQWATGTTTDISGRLGAIGPNGGTFDTNGNNVTFATGLTGTGGITKAGAGTLALAGVSTYTGATLVNAGTLALTGSGSIAASNGVGIAAGATFDISATTAGATITTLAGVAGSTVDLGGKTLTLSNASSTFAGDLTGPGGLTLAAGVAMLTGASTYTGATTVDGGLLYLGSGGAITGSATTVNAGGTLAGTGTAGSVTVNSGGIFSPGAGTAGSSMAVAGNLTFQTGAIYQVQIDPSTASQAVVTGTATLAGTVQAYFAAGSYVSKSYTILTAGSRSGTFDSLATSNLPAGFIAVLDYSVPNSVSLDLMLGLDSATGLSRNQAAVAASLSRYFNAGGALPPGFVSVVGLTGQPLAGALTQLSGEAATGAPQGAFQMMTAFLGLMTDPFVDGRSASGAGRDSGAALAFADGSAPPSPASAAFKALAKAPPAGPREPRWSVWGSAYGGSGRIDGDAMVGSHDLSARAAGFAAGGDYRVTPFTTLGFALGGGGTGWSLAQGLGSGSSDAFQAGAYGTTTAGVAYLATSLAFAEHWVSTDRTTFGGSRLAARYEAQSYGGRAEAGWRLGWLGVGLAPYAAVQAQAFVMPGFSEGDPSGGGFGLAYGDRTATALRAEAGARLETVAAVRPDAALVLRGKLAWAHDRVTDPTLAVTFQALPGAGFVVEGATPARDLALVSAGAELRFANGFALAAKLDGEAAAHSRTFAGTASIRYAW
ncbi:autotransporter domain-containing protein [Rhodoplanes azumiensis]|uniref:Autotransporter domain-containing protein n=1 Tax=Rhodoplanes azumiensis TaxID=1897628 RepID=A0ABW5AFU5_9BRAD